MVLLLKIEHPKGSFISDYKMLTWLVVDELNPSTLVSLLEDYAGGGMPIHVVWPKSHYLQPNIRVVIEMLKVLANQAGSGFNP